MRRRFWQFSMRQLGVLLVSVAVLCALISRPLYEHAKRRREDRIARQRIAAYNNIAEAVRTNDLQLAEQTFELGYPAEELFHRGNASPNQCVAKGQLAMLELLLEHGAPRPGQVFVLQSNQPREVRKKTAQLLIKFGADPAEPLAMDFAIQENDRNAAELLEELGAVFGPQELAAFNRLEELKKLVRDQPKLVNQRFRSVFAGESTTLLGIALAGGYREMSLYLIDAGAPLDICVGLGQTMLHQAARGGDPELIRMLVARGLDVHARDNYRDTPLNDIAGSGKPEAVRALLELGSDVNTQGMSRFTPLYRAVMSNRADLVRIYLDAGADPKIPALTRRVSGSPNDWQEQSTLDLATQSHPHFVKILEEAMSKNEVRSE